MAKVTTAGWRRIGSNKSRFQAKDYGTATCHIAPSPIGGWLLQCVRRRNGHTTESLPIRAKTLKAAKARAAKLARSKFRPIKRGME